MRPSTQRLLSMFLGLVLLLVFSYTIFNNNVPKWKSIQGLRSQVSDKEAVRSQVEKVRASVQEFLARSQDIDKEADPIHQALPAAPNFHEVLAIIASISASNQIAFSKIDFESTPQLQATEEGAASRPGSRSFRTPSQSFIVTLSALGEYPNFRKWMTDIETERRLLDISGVTIRSFLDKPEERRLLFNVRLTAYFQPQVKASFQFVEPSPQP